MNYIEALDWLETNYPKYDINDRIKIIELTKSGGPYIGPKGLQEAWDEVVKENGL